MKQKLFIFCCILAGMLSVESCDNVTNAAETFTVKIPGDRKILIEDYTGHKCGNCPEAARKLRYLDSIYKGQIIPVAVHAGFYANTNTQYPLDLKSTTGTDWDNTFGNSAAGNPNGMVNRSNFGKSNFIKQYSEWGTAAAIVYSDSSDFNLSLTNTYNIGTNQLTCRVRCKAMKVKTGTYNLTVILLEDSIKGNQLDYSLNGATYPGQIDTGYIFNHVLRASINSSWGNQIISGTIHKNDSIVKLYSNFQLSSTWKYKNCHVVAFIYDADAASPTYYEIRQAEIKPLY